MDRPQKSLRPKVFAIIFCEVCGTGIECTAKQVKLKRYCTKCLKDRKREENKKYRDTPNERERKRIESHSWRTEQPEGKDHYYENGPPQDETDEGLQQFIHIACAEACLDFKPINISTAAVTRSDFQWLFQ